MLDKQPTPALETPTPTPMKDDQTNSDISKVQQSGSQNIVAGRDVHIGPTPASSPALQFPAFNVATDKLYLSFGGGGFNIGFSPTSLPKEFKLFDPGEPLKLYVEQGRFCVDVALMVGPDGKRIEIKDNQLFGKPPDWDMNSGPRALEVVDGDKLPMFQFILKDASHIVINGVFVFAGRATIATDSGIVLMTNPDNPARKQLQRIFKYPAWKYPGEYELDPASAATPVSNTNISSVNQSGGFTGVNQGTVNLGPQPRSIPAVARRSLVATLSSAKAGSTKPFVGIDTSIGDTEAKSFANELRQVFEEAGWEVGMAQVGFGEEPIGLFVVARSKDDIPIQVTIIRVALAEAGFGNIPGVFMPGINEHSVRLIVGAKPKE